MGTHELRPHYALDGDEYYFVELIEQASAESLFELVFSVDADTPYELLGSIEANDFGASGFELRVRLEGPGGQPIVDVSSPGSCSPPFGCPPVGIDAGGILAPGVYTLRVRSAGAADSAPGPFMGPDDISFGSYDLSFSTDGGAAALPAIPLAWPLALALGLAGAAAARRSDPDSPSQRR